MNNIEILQEFIKHYKEVQEKYKDDEIQAEIERSCYFEEVPAQAIENLIQENKELKEENYHKTKYIDFLDEKYFDNFKFFYEMLKDTVPKSKVKEHLQELDKMKVDGEVFTTAVDFAKQILQELLEEGE